MSVRRLTTPSATTVRGSLLFTDGSHVYCHG
jgi:hypothetical protein